MPCPLAVALTTSQPESGRYLTNLSIRLDIRSSDPGGYHSTYASDGHQYYFAYSGDANSEGDITLAHSKGKTKIQIDLTSDDSHPFEFGDVYFPQDPKKQLSKISASGSTVNFKDTNDKRQDGVYEVTVIYPDGSGKYVSISPDPKIVNN